MILRKYSTLFIFFILLTSKLVSQTNFELSNFAQVSIITSGPGEALYEKFGHTAIRIKDPVLNLDLIYNYGMFDLDGVDFYVNFTKGFMKYKLARYPFHYSLKDNQLQQRWVKEQILNLTNDQKNAFFTFLENNAQPQNASYFYDPFFNNCATKPRDIIQQILGDKLILSSDFIEKPTSLRELMNIEIHPNTWASIGINIALGSKLDKIAKANEYLYLPDYVYKALNTSNVKINNETKPVIIKENTLLDFEEIQPKSDTFSPFLAFSFFLFIISFITYKDFKNNKRTKWIDFLLFFSSGLIGMLIIFLWFFTNHSTAPYNFNFLWAFAPNIVIAFFLIKRNPPKWIKKYIALLIVFLIIIPFIWLSKLQLFTYPIIPLLLLLANRYIFLYKKL